MEHVLMLPNVNLADLANSPTPTALSMIHDGDYDVTVSNVRTTCYSRFAAEVQQCAKYN